MEPIGAINDVINNSLFSTFSNISNEKKETNETSELKEEENQAELSEVDLGNTDQLNFDELISFSHTYLNYRIAKTFSNKNEINENTFGLLMSNEFLLSGTVISVDSLNSMSNSEIL